MERPENDEGAEWRRETDENRFMCARDGDMICAPFQCEECWFINLMKRKSCDWSLGDKRILGYIRRVNLDVFWSREKSTVRSNLGSLRKGYRLSKELGMPPIAFRQGPWKVADGQGMQIAIEVLRASQEKGRNDETYVQFDSIRKIRTAYSNLFESSLGGARTSRTFKGGYGKTFALTSSPTDSLLFRMFMKGCEKRMGRLVNQDLGISIEVLLEMLRMYEMELWNDKTSTSRRRDLVMAGAAFVALFGGALRGGEILLAEATELVKRQEDGKYHSKHPHVVLPLMGRFKGETGERNVLLVMANTTSSGLEIRKWIERLGTLLRREGRHRAVGPAFCTRTGFVFERWRLNGILHETLGKIQVNRPDLLAPVIQVEEKFSIYRSFRRGATTRAKEAKVSEPTIQMNNRWRKVQNRSGGLPNLPMSELYVEISQALGSRTRFSKEL